MRVDQSLSLKYIIKPKYSYFLNVKIIYDWVVLKKLYRKIVS